MNPYTSKLLNDNKAENCKKNKFKNKKIDKKSLKINSRSLSQSNL